MARAFFVSLTESDPSRALVDGPAAAAVFDEPALELDPLSEVTRGGVAPFSPLPLGIDAALFSALYLSNCLEKTVF